MVPPSHTTTPAKPPKKQTLHTHLLTYHANINQCSSIKTFTTHIPSYDLFNSKGHYLLVIDPSTTFWLLLQIPNGLILTKNNLTLQQDLQACHDYGTATLSVPATNVNRNLPEQQAYFTATLHRTWRNALFVVSKSPEDFLSQYQPGGTTTVVCENWISRLVDWPLWPRLLVLPHLEGQGI